MKITLISFLLVLLFLFCVEAAGDSSPLLDTNGDEVKVGEKYYLVSTIRGAGGGGLALSHFGTRTCPFSVIQLPTDTKRGLPATFHPYNSENGTVFESTDLNVQFDVKTPCGSSVWQVANYDEPSGNYYLKIGGVLGQPGIGTLSNWFKIERQRAGYKFVFCPTVANIVNVACQDAGIYFEEDKRRMGLVDGGAFFFDIIKRDVENEALKDDM